MADLITETALGLDILNLKGRVEFLETGINSPYKGGIPGQSPSFRIIQDDQGFRVRFRWLAYGWLAPMIQGHYHLAVHFERQGPQPSPPSVYIATPSPLPAGTLTELGTEMVEDIILPSFFLNVAPDTVATESSAMFRITATLVFHGDTSAVVGGTPHLPAPVAGFADLGLFQVYSGA